MSELMPCPFCGGDDVIIEYHVDDLKFISPYISCVACGVYGPQSSDGDESIAIERWNKRDELALTSQQSYKLMNNIIAHERMINGLQMNYRDLYNDAICTKDLSCAIQKIYNQLDAQQSNILAITDEINSLSRRLNAIEA